MEVMRSVVVNEVVTRVVGRRDLFVPIQEKSKHAYRETLHTRYGGFKLFVDNLCD